MPLPEPNQPFPTVDLQPVFEQYQSNRAWAFGGDQDIAGVYGGWETSRGDDSNTHFNRGGGSSFFRRAWRSLTRPFWAAGDGKVTGGGNPPTQKTRLHSPIAGNLSALSSDLLYAEPPRIVVQRDGKPLPSDDDLSKQLAQILDEQFEATMSEAGEWVAGLSSACLVAQWDRQDGSRRPWVTVSPADSFVPEYRGSTLTAVNLFTTYHDVAASGRTNATYTHVERHEPGSITHALYRSGRGDGTNIGVLVNLDDWIPQVAHYRDIIGHLEDPDTQTIILNTGIDRITAYPWINLPTRRYSLTPATRWAGRADFEGAEQVLDKIDLVWSAWMRDIVIGRARLFVPEQYLEAAGPGGGPAFDEDSEILTPFAGAAINVDGGVPQSISAQQFAIRASDHAATLDALVLELLTHAGISPASYQGVQQGSAQRTATEVTADRDATNRTRKRKIRYHNRAVVPLVEALLDLNRVHYRGDTLGVDDEVVVTFPTVDQIAPLVLAQVQQTLRAAQAASTKTLVLMQHPDWEPKEIDEEVLAIIAENPGLAGELEADPTVVDRVDPLVNPQPSAGGDPSESVVPEQQDTQVTA
jgi:hypothetical protein